MYIQFNIYETIFFKQQGLLLGLAKCLSETSSVIFM